MLRNTKYMFSVLPLVAALALLLPQTGLQDRLQSAFRRYQERAPEKLYLHTDKPFYSSGEVIWFKVYQVDAVSHVPGGPSGLARVDLLAPDGDLAFSRFIKLEDGSGKGDFVLPDSLASGQYQLQAYTRYMRAFDEDFLFRKDLTIWNRQAIGSAFPDSEVRGEAFEPLDPASESAILVRFFPEGGDLVAGLASRIAVRAENGRGEGRAVRGTVKDEGGRTVATFTTDDLGLGHFDLTPRAGGAYQATLDGNAQQTFGLPEVLTEGFVLRAETSEEALRIAVRGSAGTDLSDLHLVGHSRGELLFVKANTQAEGEAWDARLDLGSVPEGVLHLTLMDGAGRPYAERLVFVQHPEDRPQLRIQSLRETYPTRSPVTLQLDLLDPAERPMAGDLSVTVTGRDLVPRDPQDGNILTWLLLNSDLRGDVPDPGYYFEPGHEEDLDLLMLTQGWRRFTWQQMLDGDWPSRTLARKGFTVAGNITRQGSEQPEQAFIWLNTLGYGEVLEARTVTSSGGRFAIHDLPIEDTTVVVVQARRPRGAATLANIPESPRGKRDLDIEFVEPEVPQAQREVLPGPRREPQKAAREDYLAESRRIQTIERAFGGISVLLDEVVVTAERLPDDYFKRPGMLYSEPDNRVIADSMTRYFQPNSAFDLLRNIAGVQIVGGFPREQAIIRGGQQVLYLLDGMPVDVEVIRTLNPWDIAFIDVLKGPSAAVYGGRGGSGVIAVYTKRGEGEEPPERGPGIDHFTHPGFYRAKRFFQPVYEEERPEHERPDLRTTLFWKPEVRMGVDGKALLTIWTSDQTGTYEVRAEGVARNGAPVVGAFSFSVD